MKLAHGNTIQKNKIIQIRTISSSGYVTTSLTAERSFLQVIAGIFGLIILTNEHLLYLLEHLKYPKGYLMSPLGRYISSKYVIVCLLNQCSITFPLCCPRYCFHCKVPGRFPTFYISECNHSTQCCFYYYLPLANLSQNKVITITCQYLLCIYFTVLIFYSDSRTDPAHQTSC